MYCQCMRTEVQEPGDGSAACVCVDEGCSRSYREKLSSCWVGGEGSVGHKTIWDYKHIMILVWPLEDRCKIRSFGGVGVAVVSAVYVCIPHLMAGDSMVVSEVRIDTRAGGYEVRSRTM